MGLTDSMAMTPAASVSGFHIATRRQLFQRGQGGRRPSAGHGAAAVDMDVGSCTAFSGAEFRPQKRGPPRRNVRQQPVSKWVDAAAFW